VLRDVRRGVEDAVRNHRVELSPEGSGGPCATRASHLHAEDAYFGRWAAENFACGGTLPCPEELH